MKTGLMLVFLVLLSSAVSAEGQVAGYAVFFHLAEGHLAKVEISAREIDSRFGHVFFSHDDVRHKDDVVDLKIDGRYAALLTHGEHGWHIVVVYDGGFPDKDRIGITHAGEADARAVFDDWENIQLYYLDKGNLVVN